MASETNILELLSQFKEPQIVDGLIKSIENHEISQQLSFMEVCGTHTMSIARAGLRSLLPSNIKLLSGPGCPVCVTANCDIDKAIAISKMKNVCICTFGDMMRVPGSSSSLFSEQANGADVRICYSPLDALEIAKGENSKQVVFIGIGFETTTPTVAMTIKRAASLKLNNFSILCLNKNMPFALKKILCDDVLKVDGLILPGHVSTIIGKAPYEFIAKKYSIPGVITGFDAVDILRSIEYLIEMIGGGKPEIKNAYERCVEDCGNKRAVEAIDEIFDTCDSKWRGLGIIENSGYAIKDEYDMFDAMKKLSPEVEEEKENKSCVCGEILRGKISPHDCKLFGKACNPENPIGPCMVSSEGTCAAYYRYHI